MISRCWNLGAEQESNKPSFLVNGSSASEQQVCQEENKSVSPRSSHVGIWGAEQESNEPAFLASSGSTSEQRAPMERTSQRLL